MPDLQSSVMSELKRSLSEAVEEVFVTTFAVRPELIPPDEASRGLSAIISLSGSITGYLAIHASPKAACTIASNMLGDAYTEVDDIVCDAMGEMANMVGGSLKKYVGRSGTLFTISVPTIVQGRDYSTHTPKDAEQLLMGVSALDSRLTMQLVVTEHR